MKRKLMIIMLAAMLMAGFGIWQACIGRIPGIGGNTDLNVLYTDKRYK